MIVIVVAALTFAYRRSKHKRTNTRTWWQRLRCRVLCCVFGCPRSSLVCAWHIMHPFAEKVHNVNVHTYYNYTLLSFLCVMSWECFVVRNWERCVALLIERSGNSGLVWKYHKIIITNIEYDFSQYNCIKYNLVFSIGIEYLGKLRNVM